MKTRTANHKTARCITCPHFGVCNKDGVPITTFCILHERTIDVIKVEPDYYCSYHPDNEPLTE